MHRIDYYGDPNAPRANTITPAASAIVVNEAGFFLLQQRKDDSLWALPGGALEIGEDIKGTVIREVKEETGLDVVPEYLIGVYSNPKHVIAFPNGEVRQQFSLCFACKILSGTLCMSDESLAIGFFSLREIKQLPMHRSSFIRIQHYLAYQQQPFIH